MKIAWVLSNTLEAKWVIQAVEKVKSIRKIEKPLILHTDRGVQYVCKDYIEVIDGIQRSYAKKAYPWDNACIDMYRQMNIRETIEKI